MKALKPSHREKKRYLLIKGKDASEKNIEDAVLKFVGILGYSKISPDIVKKNKNGLILCINREGLDDVRASILISGKNIVIEKVSGVINKLK